MTIEFIVGRIDYLYVKHCNVKKSTLTEEQQRLLELTIKEHKQGRSKSYTWAEARDMIQKRDGIQNSTKRRGRS